MPGSGESFPPNIQGSGDKCTCVPYIYILPNSFVTQRSVPPVHGITQLGLRSHPTESVTHETLTATFSFVRSDKLVYTTVTIRPFSPCHPSQAMAGPTFLSHLESLSGLSRRSLRFSRMPLPRARAPT